MSDRLTLIAMTELANRLSPSEQKQLAESILRQLASGATAKGTPRRSWREIRGSVPYPLCGEDAQAWVTRGRQESEELREQQWRNPR
jgi:hypothetical protein